MAHPICSKSRCIAPRIESGQAVLEEGEEVQQRIAAKAVLSTSDGCIAMEEPRRTAAGFVGRRT